LDEIANGVEQLALTPARHEDGHVVIEAANRIDRRCDDDDRDRTIRLRAAQTAQEIAGLGVIGEIDDQHHDGLLLSRGADFAPRLQQQHLVPFAMEQPPERASVGRRAEEPDANTGRRLEVERKPNPEHTPTTLLADDTDRSVVLLDDRLADREPEAAAALRP